MSEKVLREPEYREAIDRIIEAVELELDEYPEVKDRPTGTPEKSFVASRGILKPFKESKKEEEGAECEWQMGSSVGMAEALL